MRRAAKVDSNQAEIVKALRAAGCRVQSLAAVGKGVPDLLVGFAGMLFLLEVKDGAKPPSQQKLTPDEQKWHNEWRGYVWTVKSIPDALTAVGADWDVAPSRGVTNETTRIIWKYLSSHGSVKK